MIDNKRLAEILLPYGTVQKGHSPHGEWPLRHAGNWSIPLDEQMVLLVAEADLPPTVGALLELLVPEWADREQDIYRARVKRWLGGAELTDGPLLAEALEKMGWIAQTGAFVVAIEVAVGERVETELVDAVEILRELVTAQDCIIETEGNNRIYLLVPLEPDSGSDSRRGSKEPLEVANAVEGVFLEEVSGWLDTLGTELYSLFRAGVSAPVQMWTSLPESRREAQFALDAGRVYRSKERVHNFNRLGLARVFQGLPETVQAHFLQEILPDEVYSGLSTELRETVFAFLEHGQQVADTARSLYIHRNTLNYRLDRISELTHLDVRQPLPAWTLWLALTLRRAR
ncbi:PucR family transcriptional regulator [Tumebacillus permanentifrigoris]|uniref:PucR-like helix-turn-helix protein n=1 Tax=Tumebacillus permanentifrigoris TaxID=378543 RepID=A0A316D8R5_9BACL|nr:helix-turn-helix domain-containing protein [Tumebacillus permanentifrigoris]PWK13366.1 PucR-like helix-turn-helix protein [Tumebacillus permanentifrigoris]